MRMMSRPIAAACPSRFLQRRLYHNVAPPQRRQEGERDVGQQNGPMAN